MGALRDIRKHELTEQGYFEEWSCKQKGGEWIGGVREIVGLNWEVEGPIVTELADLLAMAKRVVKKKGGRA